MMESPESSGTSLSVRTYLTWLVAVTLLVDLSVIALAAYSLRQNRLQYEERAAVQTQNLSQALDYSISAIIDKADLALLAVGDEVARQRSRSPLDDRVLNDFIARQKARLVELDSIRVADAAGAVRYGTNVVPGGGVRVSDRDYFLQLLGDPGAGLAISKPVIGRISDKWVLIVARRLSEPNGTFGGVVYGVIPLEQIQKLFSRMDLGQRSGISLRDRDMGIVVRYPDPTGIGSMMGKKPMSPELRRLFESGQRTATFYTAAGWENNTPKMVSYRKLDHHPFYIIVGIASSDYLSQWWRDMTKLAALVALFIGASISIAYLTYLHWKRDREAQQVLRASKAQLECCVAERTAELFQANRQLTCELAERALTEQKLRQGRNMLAQIIDSIPQSVFWKDRDLRFLGCNMVFARAVGLAHPDDVVGKTDFDLPWATGQAEDYRSDDRAVIASCQSKYHIIEQLQQSDGTMHWIDTTKIPLCNEAGEVYGVLGVFDNITERKTVEDSRKKALGFIETLLNSSPTGILVYDGTSGACVRANAAAAAMIGGSAELLVRQNYRRLASWREAGITPIAEAVLADGQTRHIEKNFRTSFDKPVDLDCFLSRFEVDGMPHLMFMMVDISEKRRLEQENRLIEAQMLHVQKLESLGVLAGGIAHDFNNILMVVLGHADLALMRLDSESPARDNLKQIELAAGRAADLARQMLAYSGKGRFVIESLDLSAIVAEMGHMLEVSISKKVVLDYHLAPDLPAVSVDATQLRQVILNLVINASEAIGSAKGDVTIRTGLRLCDRIYLADSCIDDRLPEGPYVTLEISDTGCGIAPEIIPKIFDPFFTTKFTGRGLGMAAVLGIVRGHKGAIKMQSVQGRGTTFTLLLPALTRPAEPQSGLTDLAPLPGSGTVLLVDDEETIRELGRDMLESIGFRVITACDGQEALEVYARHQEEVDCVLLDLTMPCLDGEQTFLELRRIKPGVRVIISSGYNEQEVSQKFVGKGLAGFIQKPYKVAEVSSKLQEVLCGWPPDSRR